MLYSEGCLSLTGVFREVTKRTKHAVTIAQRRRRRLDSNCFISGSTFIFCSLSSSIVTPPERLIGGDLSVSFDPAPLLGLVRLVCGEEGHAVGPEVSVEVRGLVETPAAHLADQVPISVLALRLRGAGGRAVGRGVGALGAALRVAVGVPHAVSDEAVPAEGAGGREADAALQALEGGGVGPVLGDVALELRPILGGEAAGDAAKNVVFLLRLVGGRGRPASLRRSCGELLAVLGAVLFLVSCPASGGAALAVLLRGAPWSLSPCGCSLPGHGSFLSICGSVMEPNVLVQ